MYKKVYIILVNYNGWADTIECLESVLKNDYDNYQIIIVDNNSPNNSLDYIKMWAEGKLTPYIHKDNQLRNLSFPYINKPIPYVLYSKEEALNGGIFERENKITNFIFKNNTITTNYPLIFIQAFENKGFAAGNNIGMKFALFRNDFEYIWLLNNDTVIEKNSLKSLVDFSIKNKVIKNKIGIVGSKLLFYDAPNIIQGIGGIYNKYLAIGSHIGMFERDLNQYDNKYLKFDYVIGASMFVTKNFIKNIGLMCEEYFLYFEEMDWAVRAKFKNFKISFCGLSKVYHKEGSSIGKYVPGMRSWVAESNDLKNRIYFTKKYFKKYILLIYLSFIIVLFNRLKRKQFKKLYKIIFIIIKSLI